MFSLMLRNASQQQRAKDKTEIMVWNHFTKSLIGPRHTEHVMKGAQYTFTLLENEREKPPEAQAQTPTNSKVLVKEIAINLE